MRNDATAGISSGAADSLVALKRFVALKSISRTGPEEPTRMRNLRTRGNHSTVAIYPVMIFIPMTCLRTDEFNSNSYFSLSLGISGRDFKIAVQPPDAAISLFEVYIIPWAFRYQLSVDKHPRLLPVICLVTATTQANAMIVG